MWSRNSPYIWDGYKTDEAPSNLKLWSKVWSNLWEDERNHYFYRFEPVSLRIVLKQIIEDVCFSTAKEKSIVGIKDQLNLKLNYAKSFDSIAMKMFNTELGQLVKSINTTTKNETNHTEIILLSKYLLDRLSEEKYFTEIFVKLRNIVFQSPNPSIQELKILSQLMIVELVEKGFTIGTIINIPNNLFNKGRILYNQSLPVFKGKYWGTNLDYDIEENTPFTTRFDYLLRLYNAPRFKAKAMFLILGASAKQNEQIRIGNVEFHPPLDIEGKSEDDKVIWVFTSLEKEERNKPFLRASFVGEGIDCFNILSEAKREIYKSTDFLKYRYNYSNTNPGKIDVSKSWALLNTSNQAIHQMPDLWEGLPKYKSYYEGVDIVALHKDDIEFVEQQGKNYGLKSEVLSNNRIYQALHWVHKAKEAKHFEENFMSLWIALEYLVRRKGEKVIDAILKYIPAICLNKYFDELQDNLFALLQSQVANGYLKIDDEKIASKYGLDYNIGVYHWSYKMFCIDIPEITKYVRDRYVVERANEILMLSQNKKELLRLLSKEKERLRFELTTIYRFRNKIVHSAEYDHEYNVHYGMRLNEIVDSVLQYVMFYLQYFPERNIDDILVRSKIINELYFTKLESDPNYDIHDSKLFN